MTERWRAFAAHYTGRANFNATEAARLAGYKGTPGALAVTGCRLLRKPKIRALIDARVGRAAEARELEADDVLAGLFLIASATVLDWLDIERDSETGQETYLVNLTKATALKAIGAIKSVEPTPHGVKVVPYCKLTALTLLARHFGLLHDRVIIETPPDADDLRRRIMEKLDRAGRALSPPDAAAG